MSSLPEHGLQPNPEEDGRPQDDAGCSNEPPPLDWSADEQSAGQKLPTNTPAPDPCDLLPSHGWDTTNPDRPLDEEAQGPEAPVHSVLTPIESAPLPSTEQPLFQSFSQPEYHPPVRIPHLGHVVALAVFASFGLLGASIAIFSGLHFHLFGVTNQLEAGTEIHYALGSEVILYALMFGASVLFFPLIWHKGFFAGIQWNGAIALRLRRKLFVIASVCCALALTNGLLLPGPKDAPIEQIFRAPGAAWLMFAFGITFAPFFEELIFRGFLLPALCTGADWIAEKVSIGSHPTLDRNGRPVWPTWAIAASVAVYGGIPLVSAASIHFLPKWNSLLAIFPFLLVLLCFLLFLAFRRNPSNAHFEAFDATGHPLWSMPSMVIASILTSLPFAGMHAAQTGYSWGPFALLVGVSLVLCWARLSTRSLAASVFVHASYNFLIFSLMLIGTGGFRHLDRM